MKPIAMLADLYQGLALAGRGAGARAGDWSLHIVESSDLDDDGWLRLHGLREIAVVQRARTERHLLRPFDVLVTARSGSVQVALVPPGVSRTVAGITLLVIRPRKPESGMGHWLWYFLSSAQGREQLAKRMSVTSTLRSLSARSLGEIEVPLPSDHDLDAVARLVEASEAAHTTTLQAAQLRRETLRNAVVREVGRRVAASG